MFTPKTVPAAIAASAAYAYARPSTCGIRTGTVSPPVRTLNVMPARKSDPRTVFPSSKPYDSAVRVRSFSRRNLSSPFMMSAPLGLSARAIFNFSSWTRSGVPKAETCTGRSPSEVTTAASSDTSEINLLISPGTSTPISSIRMSGYGRRKSASIKPRHRMRSQPRTLPHWLASPRIVSGTPISLL